MLVGPSSHGHHSLRPKPRSAARRVKSAWPEFSKIHSSHGLSSWLTIPFCLICRAGPRRPSIFNSTRCRLRTPWPFDDRSGCCQMATASLTPRLAQRRLLRKRLTSDNRLCSPLDSGGRVKRQRRVQSDCLIAHDPDSPPQARPGTCRVRPVGQLRWAHAPRKYAI